MLVFDVDQKLPVVFSEIDSMVRKMTGSSSSRS